MMNRAIKLLMVAAAVMAAISISAQTKRSDDFKANYELKEVVVMGRHTEAPRQTGGWLPPGGGA